MHLRLRPPSPPAVIFLVLALVVPVSLGPRLLNADGDVARHLRHGLTMLETGQLIRTDIFSYTRAGEPFLGFEYGSQLIYALAHEIGGLAAVAILAGGLIALTYALLTRLLIRLGVDPLLALLGTIAAAVVGANQWIARPHLFTLLGTVILLGLLERRERRSLWPYPVLFLCWANLHGGWVYGLILIGLYLAGAPSRHFTAAFGLSAAGTLATPFGLALHRHVLGFFGNRFIIEHTAEFLSPDFDGFFGRLFLLALLAVITLLALVPARPSLPRLLVILANVAFALTAERNVALFALTAWPLALAHGAPLFDGLPALRDVRRRFALASANTTAGLWAVAGGLLLVMLGASHGRIAGRQWVVDSFDPAKFPVAAVAKARSAGLEGRIFHEFTWGGYILYAWPEQRVFIDGGTDHYGAELMGASLSMKALETGWEDRLQDYGVEWVLMRPESPLAAALLEREGWNVWFRDRTAVILHRPRPGFDAPPPPATIPTGDSSTGAPPPPDA